MIMMSSREKSSPAGYILLAGNPPTGPTAGTYTANHRQSGCVKKRAVEVQGMLEWPITVSSKVRLYHVMLGCVCRSAHTKSRRQGCFS